MSSDIFVFGLQNRHNEYLDHVHDRSRFDVHRLLTYDELVRTQQYDFDFLQEKAYRVVENAQAKSKGIITHWDFPSSTLLPLVCQKFGLRSATPEAVLKCEHKYWSRLYQREAAPDHTPDFCAFDPFDNDPLSNISLKFPYWIKPIRGYGSQLGFLIEDRSHFDQALVRIRRHINRFGKPFDVALSKISLPPEIKNVGGTWCIAEELISGRQCGIEGYVLDGEFHIHGVVDGVKDSRNQSFTRWEYPSMWPDSIEQEMCDVSKRLLAKMGYDNAPFGVEFFWDEENDRLSLLEINTRISQSHSQQFIHVDGVSNHEVAIRVAIGEKPRIDPKEGEFTRSAKFMLRRYEDTKVTRIPSPQEIHQIEEDFPGTIIELSVNEGTELSDVDVQDSYSFEIAEIWLGADDQDELIEKYHRVADRLHFEFADGREIEEFQFQTVRY